MKAGKRTSGSASLNGPKLLIFVSISEFIACSSDAALMFLYESDLSRELEREIEQT